MNLSHVRRSDSLYGICDKKCDVYSRTVTFTYRYIAPTDPVLRDSTGVLARERNERSGIKALFALRLRGSARRRFESNLHQQPRPGWGLHWPATPIAVQNV